MVASVPVATGPRRRLRILLVDDDRDVRTALLDYLGSEVRGAAFETAAFGADAMRKMEAWQIDVLVTDHKMPGMTGAQLIDWVQERHPMIYCIMVSGVESDEVARDAARRGVRFFPKPFSTEALGELVETVRGVTPP